MTVTRYPRCYPVLPGNAGRRRYPVTHPLRGVTGGHALWTPPRCYPATHKPVHSIRERKRRQPGTNTRSAAYNKPKTTTTTANGRSLLSRGQASAVFRGTFPTLPLCPGFPLPGKGYPHPPSRGCVLRASGASDV